MIDIKADAADLQPHALHVRVPVLTSSRQTAESRFHLFGAIVCKQNQTNLVCHLVTRRAACISGARRAAWISHHILSAASSINGGTRSSNVIREMRFYRQVRGAQSEWFTAGAGGGGGWGGGCTVVAGAFTGIASSLHSSRRQAREWSGTRGKLGTRGGEVADVGS